jgi:hypothetical protein
MFISVFVRRLGRLKRTRRASETHILIVCLRCIRTYDTLIFAHYHHAYTQQQQKNEKSWFCCIYVFVLLEGWTIVIYTTRDLQLSTTCERNSHTFLCYQNIRYSHSLLSLIIITHKKENQVVLNIHTYIHTHTHSLTR